MAELIELQIIEEIDKVLRVIYRSAHKSAPTSDPEIVELIKPLLKTIFIESVADPIDENASFFFERMLQESIKRFKMRVAQTEFVERHKFTRLQRLIDIRAILQEYYVRERRAIGFIQLWNKLKRKCDFELSQDLLERWLHQMGFQLIHSPARSSRYEPRDTIHEHPDQRLVRLKYLRAIRKHRDNGRVFLYLREVSISYMRWNLDEMDPSRAENTITIIAYFAATESGLVDITFVEQGHQTTETIVDWLKAVVAKGQAANTLILLDPKNYNDAEELFDSDSNTQKDSKMANVAAAMAGHEIVFLPSNHLELNPLHSIDFQHILDDDDEKKEEDITEEDLKIGVRHRLAMTADDEWKQYFEDVWHNEENFLRFEAFLDDDAICVDDLQDSAESDVEFIGDDNDVIHLTISDDEIIVLQ